MESEGEAKMDNNETTIEQDHEHQEAQDQEVEYGHPYYHQDHYENSYQEWYQPDQAYWDQWHDPNYEYYPQHHNDHFLC